MYLISFISCMIFILFGGIYINTFSVTYVVTYTSFILTFFEMYDVNLSIWRHFKILYACFVLSLLFVDLLYKKTDLIFVITSSIWTIWIIEQNMNIITINNIQSGIVARYLITHIILVYNKRMLDIYLVLTYMILLLTAAQKTQKILLYCIEILSGLYLLTFYQDNLLLSLAIINYVIIFATLMMGSDKLKYHSFVMNMHICLTSCIGYYCILMARNDLWIVIHHISHTLFIILKYKNMQESKFHEFAIWCNCMNLSPYLAYNNHTIKIYFSLLTHILSDSQRLFDTSYFFVSDKNKPKKYFFFSYGDQIDVRFDENLLFRRSKKYEKMMLSNANIISYGIPCIENIFTFKMYNLVQILADKFNISDFASKIRIIYMALIKRDMMPISCVHIDQCAKK